eukprot:SAG22_NODE_156_length_16999_cov_8.168047_7_plen_796_part_00
MLLLALFALFAAGVLPAAVERLDSVQVCDSAGIAAHGLAVSNATAGACVEDIGLSAATAGRPVDGNLTVTLRVSPLAETVVTVKVWGSAVTVRPLASCGPIQAVLLNGSVATAAIGLDEGGTCDLLPLRWVYLSTALPTTWTAGRQTVTLRLRAVAGPSRPVFALYTTAGDTFVPPAAEQQATIPAVPPPMPPPPGKLAPPRDIIVEQLSQAVEVAKDFQCWGPEWEAQVAAGKAPAIMTGAYTRTRPWGATTQEWKDKVICSTLGSNNNYLRLSQLFAVAYNSPQLPAAHRNPELIQRIAAALDFYRIAQGSDGAYDDRNHGNCWVGAPSRKRGTGCLEGYGHQGFSAAFVIAHEPLSDPAILEQTFDEDDNRSTPNVTRREGWGRLFNLSRAYMTGTPNNWGRGHAPNQDFADQLAAVYANTALSILNRSLGWSEATMKEFVYEALGVLPWSGGHKTENYWISEKGISMEPSGYIGGGYSDGYGDNVGTMWSWLSNAMGGDPIVDARMEDWLRAFSFFRFIDGVPSLDGTRLVNRTMMKVSSITWRHEHNIQGSQGLAYGNMASNAFAAVALNDPVAARMWYLWLQHNHVYQLDLGSNNSWYPSVNHGHNVHWPDIATDWIHVLPYLDRVLALADPESPTFSANQLLPTERTEWAFADAMAGAVSVKTPDYTLYMSLLWRGKPGARGAPAGGSNLTKTDFRGRYGQILEVPTNTTGRLWTLRFHDHAIAMNTNLRSTIDGTRTWSLPADLHGKVATEMSTGRKINALPPTMQLAPLDAVVLRFDAQSVSLKND